VTFAADAPPGVASQYPRAMNALLGTHAKVIHGYPGTSSIQVAMQRGEVQASCAFMLSSLTSVFRTAFETGDLVPFIQFGHKSDKLPGVPHILDFARTDEDRQVFNLIFMRDIISRAIFAPPNIPADRKKELRAAFDTMVKDPTFLSTADKLGLPIGPLSGAEDEAFVNELMATPSAAVNRADAALAFGLGGTDNASKPPAHPDAR
jgi:hypothetical protein